MQGSHLRGQGPLPHGDEAEPRLVVQGDPSGPQEVGVVLVPPQVRHRDREDLVVGDPELGSNRVAFGGSRQ